MALLNFSLADLELLEKFINFVLENPTVLNLPRLMFLKEFIEKFGGKVPAGEYKIQTTNTDGKCPFADDLKAFFTTDESNAALNIDSEREYDSEPELEAPNRKSTSVDNPSAVYLEEPKCFERSKKSNTFSSAKKEKDDYTDEDEQLYCNVEPNLESNDMSYTAEEDPFQTLATPKLELVDNCDEDNFYDDQEDYFTESDDDEPILKKMKRSIAKKQKRTRLQRKLVSTYNKPKKIKKPKPATCGAKCKHKCCEKFDTQQRLELCKEFWSLNFVHRKNYLLSWIECKPLGPMRSVKKVKENRKHTNHYFLRDKDSQRVRVCMSFFQTTLNIGNHQVKDAITNSDGKGNYLGGDMRGGSGPGRQARLEAIVKVKAENEAASKMKTPSDIKEEHSKQLSTGEIVAASAVAGAAPNEEKPVRWFGWNKGKKLKKDRVPQPVKCAESCKWKCHTNFSEEQRTQICSAFWDMSYKRRKDFILSRLETHDISSTTAEEYRKSNRAKRTFTNRYFFRGTRGNNIRVCAHFFMATLCIGRQFINNAQKNIDQQTGAYAGEDKRGRHVPTNKISEEMQNEIRRHIESYPTWVPHKNYKRRFLHSSLSVSKMYAEYKKQCESEQRKPVSSTFFAKIFHNDFRLSFLKPASKHAHKVSPNKKTMTANTAVSTQPVEAPKKVNPNISEFTGEEGGFWINPNGTRNADPSQSEYTPRVQVLEVSNIPFVQPTAVNYNIPSGYYHQRGFPTTNYEETAPQNLQLL